MLEMSHEQLKQGKEKRNHSQNQQADSPREHKNKSKCKYSTLETSMCPKTNEIE